MFDLLNALFPKDEEERRSSKFVERALDALRMVRDEHSVAMGTVRRAPSNLELRVSQSQYETLTGMDALRDMCFFFKDELMKDLAKHGMRTFGDHTIRVGIAPDSILGPQEIYAVVLNPERRPEERPSAAKGARSVPAEDSTRVFDEPDMSGEPGAADATLVLGDAADAEHETEPEAGRESLPEPTPPARLVVRYPDGRTQEEPLPSNRWIIGRRGSSGGDRGDGVRKLDLDLPTTVSREQLAVELEESTLLVRRAGKADVTLYDGTLLEEGGTRRIEYGRSLIVEGVEFEFVR